MNIENLISSINDIIRDKIGNFCKNNQEKELTENLTEKFFDISASSFKAIFQEFCTHFYAQYEEKGNTIEQEGKIYRFKKLSNKKYVSPLGAFTLQRRLYQHDRGGKSIFPLDEKWGMSNNFCTIGVREILLFSCAHNTPSETKKILSKCSNIDIATVSIQRELDKCGKILANKSELIDEKINQTETIPEDTEAIVASMDGANVLMREAGGTVGRPTERPVTEKTSTTYSYRNAMCGSISFYRTVNGKNPDVVENERIKSLYMAKMPQHRYVDFKVGFETQLKQLIPENNSSSIHKIMLCDGHRSLWNYIENEPLYAYKGSFSI